MHSKSSTTSSASKPNASCSSQVSPTSKASTGVRTAKISLLSTQLSNNSASLMAFHFMCSLSVTDPLGRTQNTCSEKTSLPKLITCQLWDCSMEKKLLRDSLMTRKLQMTKIEPCSLNDMQIYLLLYFY